MENSIFIPLFDSILIALFVDDEGIDDKSSPSDRSLLFVDDEGIDDKSSLLHKSSEQHFI